MGTQFLIGESGLRTDVAALPTGGYVATWIGLDKTFYVQRLDPNGDLIGGPILVETYDGSISRPQVVGLSDGRFVVTWAESSALIYHCWFDQTGNMTAAPALISDPGEFSLFQAVTAPFGDGYVVAWDAFESEITVKAFNGDGSVAAAEFTVGAAADDQLTPQLTPAVASLASAEPTFVVAWWQASGNGDPPEIRAQRFTTNGATNATPLGSEVTVNTSSGFPQSGPQIAALSEGAFVVVWIASKNDAEAADIYFQRFDQNGVKVGTETKVNTYTVGMQIEPSVAALPDGGFVVTWTSDGQDGSGYGVYAQQFDADGAPVGVEVQVASATLGDQRFPSVAASGNGYLILWSMLDAVYGRTFDPLNAPPVAPPMASVSTLEDTPSSFVAIGASDPDGDPLTYSLKPSDLPQKGSVTFQNDSFTYTPKADATGTDAFTILVTDAGGLAAEQTVTVSIAPVNDAPTDLTLASAKIKELSAVGATVAPLSAQDVDGDTLTYELVDNAGGRFSLYGYTLLVRYGVGLDYEQHKTHTVKVKATDPGGLSTEKSFTIEVVNVAQETTKGSSIADRIVGGGGRDTLGGGRHNDQIFGGGGGDTLRGGSGHDRLDGGTGKDVLFGNTGKDAFLFTTKLGRSNVDTLRDFQLNDAIWLENAIFKGIGSGSRAKPKVMLADAFQLGAVAQDAEDRILYDQATGSLYYDPDGIGAAAAVKFAVVATRKALTLSDFLVI